MNMFQTAKLGHTFDFTLEEFCALNVVGAGEAYDQLENNFDDTWDRWQDTTDDYLSDYSPLIAGKLWLFRI